MDSIEKINTREVVELTKELVRIPSENPPGNQRPIADFLESKMKEIGLNVEKWELATNKPNIVGRLPGKDGKPVLILNGHVDTVPLGDVNKWKSMPFDPVESDGRLYGLGAADMKGGLAAMISAAKNIVDAGLNLRGTLLITCVVDEEVTGFGTKSLVDKGYRADFAVIGEPTELMVQTAHKGALEFNIQTRGVSVHASMPRRGINAVYKMSKVCLALERYLNDLEGTQHPLVGTPSINVGRIEGGTARNVVPENCEIWVERRTLPGERFEDVKRDLAKVLTKIGAEDPELRLDWNVTLEVEAAETPSDSLVVKKSIEAVTEVTGREIGVSGCVATTDMHFLVNQGKIPTIMLGPGSVNQAHTADEYVEIQQLLDSTKIYQRLLTQLLS